MDKQIYLAVSKRLANEVPELRWIDYDWGQLNDERPPVAFPCALIDIAFPDCKNLAEGNCATDQIVQVVIAIKLAFEPIGNSQVGAPDSDRAIALKPLDVIENLHKALQGWSDGIFAGLARRRGSAVPRRDKLKVYNIFYETRVINSPD